MFLFESMDGGCISPQNIVLFVDALRASIPVDAHLFAHAEHGAGLAEGIEGIPEESAWPEMFHQWLTAQGFIAK